MKVVEPRPSANNRGPYKRFPGLLSSSREPTQEAASGSQSAARLRYLSWERAPPLVPTPSWRPRCVSRAIFEKIWITGAQSARFELGTLHLAISTAQKLFESQDTCSLRMPTVVSRMLNLGTFITRLACSYCVIWRSVRLASASLLAAEHGNKRMLQEITRKAQIWTYLI